MSVKMGILGKEKPENVMFCFISRNAFIGSVMFLFSFASIITIIVFLSSKDHCCELLKEPEEAMLKIVSRSGWAAQPSNNVLPELKLPVHRIIIAHTATQNCSTQAICSFRVYHVQMAHMDTKGLDDIGYNFLIGGDGAVYEGCGWDKEGVHTKGYNDRSLSIAFIGTFNELEPPERQILAAKKLIEIGEQLQKIDRDFAVYGQCQLMVTESPGDALYPIIKKWPHWTDILNVD